MTTTKPEKAERLQESDVHEVCRQLISAGQKPTVVKLFKQLQRGSMTTIQKFLNTFSSDLSDDTSTAVELPKCEVLTDDVKQSMDSLIAKVFKLATDRAREEFTGERTRLTAEIATLNAELVECREFSDSQNSLIEELKEANQGLTIELSDQLAASQAKHEQLITSQARQQAEIDQAKAEATTNAEQLKQVQAEAKTEQQALRTALESVQTEKSRLEGMLTVYESIGGSSVKSEATTAPAKPTRKAKKTTGQTGEKAEG
jgi:chromosome segregation ATPase